MLLEIILVFAHRSWCCWSQSAGDFLGSKRKRRTLPPSHPKTGKSQNANEQKIMKSTAQRRYGGAATSQEYTARGPLLQKGGGEPRHGRPVLPSALGRSSLRGGPGSFSSARPGRGRSLPSVWSSLRRGRWQFPASLPLLSSPPFPPPPLLSHFIIKISF